MDVVVVYESLFGNTRLVAEAIADGIRAANPAARVSVTRTAATKLGEVDDACLLVVGGPTHIEADVLTAQPPAGPAGGTPRPAISAAANRNRVARVLACGSGCKRFLPPSWAPRPRPLIRGPDPGSQAGPPARPAAS